MNKKIVVSLVSSLLSSLILVLQLVLVARFLEPEELGAFSIVLVVLNLARVFAEGGMGNAIISCTIDNKKQYSSLFWFNAMISSVVALIIVMIAPALEYYYSFADLESLLVLCSLSIPFFSLSRVCSASLQKNMRTNLISVIDMLSKLISVVVVSFSVSRGYGVFSLVYGNISMAVFLFFVNFYFSSTIISPWKGFRFSDVKPFFRFSVVQLIELLFNQITRSLDVLIIAKVLGGEISGVYSIFKNILIKIGDVIIPGLSRYFFPYMAKIRHDPAALMSNFMQYVSLSCLLLALPYSFVAANNQIFISNILGVKYIEYADIFILMAFWLLVRFLCAPVASLWLVKMKPQIGVYWNVIMTIFTTITIYLSYAHGLSVLIQSLILMQFCAFLAIGPLTIWLIGQGSIALVTIKPLIFGVSIFVIICSPSIFNMNELIGFIFSSMISSIMLLIAILYIRKQGVLQ